jgi:Fe-S cluster assembly protein SufD
MTAKTLIVSQNQVLHIKKLLEFQNISINQGQNLDIYFEPKQSNLTPTTITITQQSDSSFKFVSIFANSISFDLEVKIVGDNTTTNIYSLVKLSGDQEVFLNQKIQTNCKQNQVEHFTKIILDNNSKADISHTALALPKTSELKLNQKIQSILLSPKSRVKMQPILQIQSEDVQCKHGSSTGFLDLKAIYFLQSRGLSSFQSQKLLINSFEQDITKYWEIRRLSS